MPAVQLDCGSYAVGFAAMMSQPQGAFYIDLKNATLLEVINEYIKFKEIRRPNFGKAWSTTKMYITKLQFLSPRPIMPVDVGEIFYPYLIQCMLSHGCATSTVEHTLCQIRSAIGFGSRYGATISPTYDKFDFVGRNKQKTILSHSELCHIYYYDISTIRRPDGKRYNKQWYEIAERVRDMLIFSSIFGQRHSDSVRITQENFDGDRFTITQQKTGNTVSFNYLEYAFDKRIARSLLMKYDYCSPYTGHIANYNKRIKEVIKAIGGEFLMDIVTEEKIQGKIVRTVRPRYEAIASHTARRSAISYWANKGKSPQWIKKMSGHTDLRSLSKYMLDEED